MRSIYRIARTELANLFYSPVAWVLLIIFVVMSSMTFGGGLESLARTQEFGRSGLADVSSRLFYGRGGLWNSVVTFLYLLMPLLTMGVLSQEFNRGTFKLLYAAPITARQIVVGKYIGIMLYGLLLCAILLLYVMIGWILIDNFEWKAVLTGLLGLYLLYGLYASIGIFMSSLTNYQIVSAIGMFVLLTLLNMTSGWLQEYAFFRELTYWLALGDRTQTFIKGLICSEDVLYFILVSVMFLSFAILKLQLRRESVSIGNKVSRYAVIVFIVMLIGFITSRPLFKFYYDATLLKENTLTKTSQDIVSKLNGGLKITAFVNMFDPIYTIEKRNVLMDRNRYEQYVRFKPEIKMDHVFYYYQDTTSEDYKRQNKGKTFQQVVENTARMWQTRLRKYLTLEDFETEQKRRNIDLSKEDYYYVALLERENGRRTFLRVFNDAGRVPHEAEISAALQRLVGKVPKVGFLEGHGERSIKSDRNRDYRNSLVNKNLRSSLLTLGFDFESLDLTKKSGKELDSLDILVIADPRTAISQEELMSIERYIEQGGNLFILSEPKTYSSLQPLMTFLGLAFEPGALVQRPFDEYPANLLMCTTTDAVKTMGFCWLNLYASNHFSRRKSYIVMPNALSIKQIEDRGFRNTPIMVTRDSMVWNELQTVDFVNDTVRLDTDKGEYVGRRITAMALEREMNGKQQRILVLGDADCLSMGELGTIRRGINSANKYLILPIFQWLSNGQLPLDTRRPGAMDNVLYLGWESSKILEGILQWGLPILLFVVGSILLLRRRGK